MSSVSSVYPSESTGGTWVAANEHRVTLALINWYSIPGKISGKAKSRGMIIPELVQSKDSNSASIQLSTMSLKSTKPFRLIGIYAAERLIVEWRWDLHRLESLKHEWEARAWISSGYDEAGAMKTRAAEFRRMSAQKSFGSIQWLRRFHASHKPECGAYSVCMHRDDAVTVSYTEIVADNRGMMMNYHSKSLCEHKKFSSLKMSFK